MEAYIGVYVKGMEKPNDCVSCDFRRDDKCMAMSGKNLSEFAEDETFLMFGWIPSCCPLVEVEFFKPTIIEEEGE